MAEDENKTDGESDVLLQGAESVVSGKVLMMLRLII